MRIAFEEMIYWMEDDWGIPATEAYMLLGADRRGALHADGQSEVHLHLQGQQKRPLRIFRLRLVVLRQPGQMAGTNPTHSPANGRTRGVEVAVLKTAFSE